MSTNSISRLNLHNLLKTITDNVYYQPPAKMEFPCIKYEKSDYNTGYSNNKIYKKMTHYTVTYISKNPDNEDVTDQILNLPYCSFNRRFINDNLYHDVFDLFYENNKTN